ncbi:MAG TPA: hypothetical protein VJI75_01635 [Candidatus Nanoarchaeia archaeon]|nr:hypothetical protein [Candidatus Nanoarchaeia archaeon]
MASALTDSFSRGLQLLIDIGLADVMLPFMLIFTLVFAIMMKTEVLGKNKRYNGVLALVLALATVIPHVTNSYPPGSDVIDIINIALPNVSVVVIAIIMLVLLVGIFAGGQLTTVATAPVVLIFLVIIIYIFGAAAAWWSIPESLSFMKDSDTQALLIVIAVFAIIIWFIVGEKKPTAGQGLFHSLGELFKPGGGASPPHHP